MLHRKNEKMCEHNSFSEKTSISKYEYTIDILLCLSNRWRFFHEKGSKIVTTATTIERNGKPNL